MSERGATARQRLEAWRAQGADRLDPVRFHHMDALERRAAGHDGEARRWLDERLAALLDAYDKTVERASSAASRGEAFNAAAALATLTSALAGHAAGHGVDRYPELAALDDFKQRWSRLRTESQLRQSLKPAPADAGPLNSGTLVHRSIALMREISPGYLQHFVSYIDALSWMEQMGYGMPLSAEAPRAPGPTKKRAAKPRARQD